MRNFIAITKALSDETRVRALMSLKGGELCVCQIIDLLELAPSTVSRHMAVLYQAGLVERRKEGRWQYYRMAGAAAAAEVRSALRWVRQCLAAAQETVQDSSRLETIRAKELQEVSACYRS